MQNRTKKTIWVFALVLVIVAGVFAYWWFFMRAHGAPSGEGAGGAFPEAGNVGEGLGELGGGTGEGTASGAAGTEAVLRQLSTEPVAGAVVFSREGGIVVRWAERGTGHFFEEGVTNPSAGGAPRRISNQTIPEIGEALWRPDGLGVIVRYAKKVAGSIGIENFYAAVAAGAKEGDQLKASFLPKGIRALAFSPTGNTLFYLSENQNGSTGILSGPDGTKKTSLVELPLKDLAASWPTNSTVFLATRAAAEMRGTLFAVSTQGGALESLTSGEALTALPNRNGTRVLLSRAGGALSILNRATSVEAPLGLSTLSDKCVWGKRERATLYCAIPQGIPSGFPDSWYQGEAETRDTLWKIDAEGGETSVVSNFSEAREGIDALNLDISPDDSYLIFQNKSDLRLWLLKL